MSDIGWKNAILSSVLSSTMSAIFVVFKGISVVIVVAVVVVVVVVVVVGIVNVELECFCSAVDEFL